MPICKHCGESFSFRAEVNGKKVSLTARKFCLTCSPYGSNNRRVSLEDYAVGKKWCPKCKMLKSLDDFYERKSGGRHSRSGYCKECLGTSSGEAKKRWKREALSYVGATACYRCGYGKCIEAIEFHHEDPKVKDFGFGNRKGRLTEKDKTELDKTVVVCCRCHREIHYVPLEELANSSGSHPEE